MKYTDDQKRALNYRGGNLLIIACAGSGKTQVLSRRIAFLISEGVPRESIVAFTFTDMAAGELKSRIRKELSLLKNDGRLDDASLGEMYIGTIHSFCLQLLKEIDSTYRNFEIIDEERQAAIVVSHYKDFGLPALENGLTKIEIIKRFIETIGIVYRENIDINILSNVNLINSLKSYKAYMYSRPQCFLTFDEIIAELIRQIKSNEVIRDKIQNKFTNIFVDEYQDVDDRQEELIQLLSAGGTKAYVCAVGDDDQAIYRFRGASVDNILSFRDRYPNVESVTLSVNFRSSHAIVEIANMAVMGTRIGKKHIDGLRRRLPKTMEAKHYNTAIDTFVETLADHGDVWNCSFATDEDEAVFVANKIEELLGIPWNDNEHLRGLSLADMAILCRSVNHANVIMEELDRRGIHYVVKGATGLFEHNEIKIAYAVFSLLGNKKYIQPDPNRYGYYNFLDEAQTRDLLRHLINNMRTSGKMPNADPNIVFAWIAQKRQLFDRMNNLELRKRLRLTRRIFPQAIFYELLEQLGANFGDSQWEDTILYNLGRFSELILGFESVHQWITPYDIGSFTYYLGFWVAREADKVNHEDIGGQNAIQITTVHQAKGLEWPVVFMPSLTNLRFPSNQRNRETLHLMAPEECIGRPNAKDNPVENRERLDEELRLWYVALTRSKKYLFLTSKVAPRCTKSRFADVIRHNYVCDDPTNHFTRPAKTNIALPVNAEILPTTFSDLRYYWECPYDYKLRRLMRFSPGVVESYGYGQQIHNLLALLHDSIRVMEINDAWIETAVEENFNLRYTQGDPLDAMKAAAKRILKSYLHDYPDLGKKVLSSEKPFEFIIGDAMISGTIDLLNNLGDDLPANSVEVIDFKTGKNGEDLSDGERMDLVAKQLLLYSIAAKDALGYDPQQAAAHFLYSSRPHERKYIELSEQKKQQTSDLISDTVANIKENHFPMCALDTNKCSSCDFKAVCIGAQRTI
jgi:DNA helicase-2/ATP-dependent DNA helicase PcrA